MKALLAFGFARNLAVQVLFTPYHPYMYGTYPTDTRAWNGI